MRSFRKLKKYSQPKHILLLLFLLFSFSFSALSQITAFPIQDFSFGTFYQGNAGGTISLSTEGSRTSAGDIVLLNSGPATSQAVFEIEAPENTLISILTGLNTTLTGSNGGTMALEITGSNPESLFTHTAVSPGRSRIHFSGKLTVGDQIASPAGIYQGTISITFNNE
jgi:hypothetical protein